MRISDWSSDVCSSDLGAEPLRHDADELLLRALASLVLDAFLEPRGAAEELVVELDGAAQQLTKIVPLRQEEAQGVADLPGGLLRNAEPGSHDDGGYTLARLQHEVDALNPLPQRQLGRVQGRFRRHS